MSQRIFATAIMILGIWTSAAFGQESTLWTYSSGDEDIGHFEIIPSGSIFTSREDRVVMLEPDTGNVIWERTDIRDCKKNDDDGTIRCRFLNQGGARFSAIPDTDFGLFEIGFRGVANTSERYAVVDLGTGATIWDSLDIPFERTRGFLYIARLDQFLLSGETPDDRGLIVKVRGSDGNVMWQQEIDFLDRFSFIGAPNDTQVLAYGKLDGGRRLLASMDLTDGVEQWRLDSLFRSDARNRNILLESQIDGTVVLYMTKDGPFRLDLANGEVVWRAENWDEDPPDRGKARMVVGDELIFVPDGRNVDALRLEDGSLVWQTAERFDAEPVDMFMVPNGLFVRSRHFDVLEPNTGASVWTSRAGRFDESAPIQLDEGIVYVAAEEAFSSVDLTTGAVTTLAEYDFEGEQPTEIEPGDGSLLLMSRQNLLRITFDGSVRYHAYLKAPGAGFLANLTTALALPAAVSGGYCLICDALDATPGGRRASYGAASTETFGSYFIYTDESLDDREGFSLVRLDKESGTETGRMWRDERNPNYIIDEITETVYFQESDSVLRGLNFETDFDSR